MDGGQDHLRQVRRGPRWGLLVLAVLVAAVTLLVVGSTTGQCVDAVRPGASACTASPSGPARLVLGLVGASAVVVLLRRALGRR